MVKRQYTYSSPLARNIQMRREVMERETLGQEGKEEEEPYLTGFSPVTVRKIGDPPPPTDPSSVVFSHWGQSPAYKGGICAWCGGRFERGDMLAVMVNEKPGHWECMRADQNEGTDEIH